MILQIWLRILIWRWKDYLWLSNLITQIFRNGEPILVLVRERCQERGIREMQCEKDLIAALGLEVGGSDHSPGMQAAARSWDRQDTHSPLEPLKRSAATSAFDLKLERPMLNLGPKNYMLIINLHNEVTECIVFVLAARGNTQNLRNFHSSSNYGR